MEVEKGRKKTVSVESGVWLLSSYWVIVVSITPSWLVCYYGTNPLGKVWGWSWSLEEALGKCNACRKYCCDFVDSPIKTSGFESVLSHNVTKQYDSARVDMKSLTYSDTKNTRPHLQLSYPGCGIIVHIHLVWNPNTMLVNMSKGKPLFEGHMRVWGLCAG